MKIASQQQRTAIRGGLHLRPAMRGVKQVVAYTYRCHDYAKAFNRFKARARELQKSGMLGEATFIESVEDIPGFGLDYGRKQLRFMWEPVRVGGEMRGQVVLLESPRNDQFKVKWSRLAELTFGPSCLLDDAQLPDEDGIVTFGNPGGNSIILLRLILFGLLKAPLRVDPVPLERAFALIQELGRVAYRRPEPMKR